jgi:hypothetical protein
MACVDGLEITVDPPMTVDVDTVVTLVAEGGLAFQCSQAAGASGGACSERGVDLLFAPNTELRQILIRDAHPEQLNLTVSAGSDERSLNTNPEYQVVQPNGPDCVPTCRTASATLGR